ncbi:MAG TPA: NAD(P)-dependent alcohol dehydrogenase [Acidimicrobiales bacterium]|jgi:propanol-preferring alcohol dehydrogenase|nr:NAD(P)-dependent alcohol dehydrogenase [Acidimicrobiales bacterium]
MRALQITRTSEEPVLNEVDDPKPGPGQVVIKVGAAGACHSDISILEMPRDANPMRLPFTLGHESAGWVHELGDGVKGLEIGQAVVVYGAWGCGVCGRCRSGVDNYCEDPAATVSSGGLGADGGMAEYLLVPDARHLVPLPEGLDPVAAAPLTDAGLTPYHAIKRSWPKLVPTSTAVVIGAGGLGHMAVQILKATTAARIVVVDMKKEALELAESLGADHTVEAGELAPFAIRELTGGKGADVVLDFVGNDATLAMAAASLRPLGDLTIVGIAGGSLHYNFFTVPYELSVQSVYWGTRAELVEVLELAARGLLKAHTTTYPLDRATEAYRALWDGTLTGRAVIIPNNAP